MSIKKHSDGVERLRGQATALAGRTGELVQRATVYHHLYAHSGRNHCFPLLAAHGALWASGYFKSGMRFGAAVAAARGLIGADPRALMERLNCFAEAFRDINRRVCLETFFIYRITDEARFRDEAERLVPADLLIEMDRCHSARRLGRTLSQSERRSLFTTFFLWEQANIVGPSVKDAFANFDWPLISAMAQRPKISFSYFDNGPLRFRDFSSNAERVEMGMRAFDRACVRGWRQVELALCNYGVMPPAFSAEPGRFFDEIVRVVAPAGVRPPAIA